MPAQRRSQNSLTQLIGRLSPGRRRHLRYRRNLSARVGAAMEGRARSLSIPARDLGPYEADLELVFGPALRDARLKDRLLLLRALRTGGVLAEITDALDSEHVQERMGAARLAGTARIPGAVPWLARLLGDRDHCVRRTAAKALGRIGGAAASDALVRAIQRRRLSADRLAADLARAAPDRYLEDLMARPPGRDVAGHAAVAYGLRRDGDVLELLEVLREPWLPPREVAQVLRGLGYLRDPLALPALADRLRDPAWQVRAGACEALGRFRLRELATVLRERADDPEEDQRVRRAARVALRRVGVSA